MKNKKEYENLYTKEEIKMAQNYDKYLMEQEEIKMANEIIIEKKGDFLRIGNTLVNLKNVDAIAPDCMHVEYFTNNVKIAYVYFNIINSQKAIDIIIAKLMKAINS